MFLKFLGNGSAFSKTHTSGYFDYNDDIYFIDMSMYNVDKAMSLKPEDYSNIYIFITHMHDDHAGGLGLFIEKLYFLKGRKPIICVPRELFGDIFVYLKTIGVRKDMYKIMVLDKGKYYKVYKVDHAPELAGKCFGYRFDLPDISFIYTGDTSSLKPFMGDIRDVDELYTECATTKSPVHYDLESHLDELNSIYKNGTKVYLMHIDNEEKVRELIKGYPFEIVETI